MFTKKELKDAFNYLYNELKTDEDLSRPERKELDTLFGLVVNAIRGNEWGIGESYLRKALEFTFPKILKTNGIIPTWLKVGHLLVVGRLYKELNGKEN